MRPKRREPIKDQFESGLSGKMPLSYRKRRYPAEVSASKVSGRNSRLTPAMRDDALESSSSTPTFLLRSGSISRKHRPTVFFKAEEVNFRREMACGRGTYQFAKEKGAEGHDEGSLEERKVSLYQHVLEAESFAIRAVEVQHREYVILKGFGGFPEAQGENPRSPDYPNTFPRSSFREFLRFMLYTFEGEEVLKEEASRRL